jgi:2,4-dienoyl-CoA reductase-like NADH-dependent reductase (Old Yellow Enzyme family)/thioredoxin reductase
VFANRSEDFTDSGAKELASLFSSLKVGGLELKNRIVMTPVVTGRQVGGVPTESLKSYYEARARGGAALIMVENAMVDPSTAGLNLELHHDRFIGPLKELTDAIHAGGALAGIQLNHLGRQWPVKNAQVALVAPSPLPWSSRAPVPRELSAPEIGSLVKMFRDAAARAGAAGFDVIEIHAAHGYLLSEFLSPGSNQRGDEYGGSVRARARFAEEIIQSVRQRLGGGVAVSCRVNGADNVAGGLELEDAKVIAQLLVAAGVDLISVSAGAFGSYPTIVPPIYAPRNCYVHLAEAVKRVVSVPVITVGRIRDPHSAEQILRAGKADFIGLARPLVADPELPNKWQRGEFDQVNPCISCNNCIETSAPGPMTCTVNPSLVGENEAAAGPAHKKKRVFVAGGGLAGLEAARVAALRGHQVTLYEQDTSLGGQWRLASAGPCKHEFMEAAYYRVKQINRLGVETKIGRALTPETIKEKKPDVVVVATGAQSMKLPVEGGALSAISAWEVLGGKAQVGDRVLVVGGGSVGLETADFLAEQGKSVTIVEMTDHVGADVFSSVRWHLMPRLATLKVQILRSTKVERVDRDGIVVTKDGSQETLREFDTVVFAVGSRSENSLAESIQGLVAEVYVIGDAVSPCNGLHAISEGYEVGRRI